jgi:tRNA pseudouridine13 synthase
VPSDEGEHLLVHVRKRDQNTQWVAGLLAQLAQIKRTDIGFCGLKDRFAVTTQWYSLHLPGRDVDLTQLRHADFEILAATRHDKKLRRGVHRGNRFNITLREVDFTPATLDDRLQLITQLGVPNYFAEQRFGHQGNNLHKAQSLIDADKLKGNKQGTGIYLSAARSWLFNLLVKRRIELGHLTQDFAGDRSAALWGRGRSNAGDLVAQIEADVLDGWQSWCYALEHAGLKQARRDITLRPQRLEAHWLADDRVKLQFSLEAGCYATAVLREISQLIRPEYKPL